MALAVLGSSLWLLILDRIVTAATSGSGEDLIGARGLLSLFGALTVFQIAVAASWLLVRGVGAWVGRVTGGWRWRVLASSCAAGALASFPFHLVGEELSSGDWISQQPYAWVVHLAICAGGALAIAAVAGLDAAAGAGTGAPVRWRVALQVGALVASVALAWFNVTVWFSLYPHLHIATYLLSALLSFVAFRALTEAIVARRSNRLRAGLSAVVTALLATGIATWLTMDRGTRSEVLAGAATCTDTVRRLADRGPRGSLMLEALESLGMERARAAREERHPRGLIRIPPDWNIVWIISDATRADALPPNRTGKKRLAHSDDTPFIDGWLEGAVRFRHAYAQAACTSRSMPPLFRSLEPHQDSRAIGVSLGNYARSLGRKPIAAVPSFFVESRLDEFNQLLDGFEDVEVYHEADMDRELEITRALIERNRKQPFLAWIHFYALHIPGWADGKRLGRRYCDPQECYSRSLRWLDGQFERLMESFEGLGLAEKTVFILGADHGQSLGEKRAVSHGANVWEETVRVPLAFRVPGRPGHLVDGAVVGNIDIVPTIADLAGAPENPTHRGRSLVPLMVDPAASWHRDYYCKSRHADVVGLVRGRHKLVHYADGDALYRYDVWSDPNESRNLFDLSNDLDRSLLQAMLYRAPERFASQLKEPEARALLLQRLQAVGSSRDGEDIAFLLKLAALEGSPEVGAEVRRIYGATDDLGARLAIIGHSFSVDPETWSAELTRLVESGAGTERELEIVRQLAVQGQQSFSPRFVAERMQWWAEHGTAGDWLPWLEMIRAWPKKTEGTFGRPLLAMLRAAGEVEGEGTAGSGGEERSAGEGSDVRVLEPLLVAVGSLRPARKSSLRSKMADAILSVARHPDPLIRGTALRSLGFFGDADDADDARRILDESGQALQVRQGALWAVARIDGEAAIPLLTRMGDDPMLTLDAVDALREIGSAQALPYLDRVAKKNFHFLIRGRAKRAAETIRKKGR